VLTSILDLIKNLFATHNVDFVLKQLAVLDLGFNYINQKYHWSKSSTDRDFCECTYQALWSANPTIPSTNPDLLSKDQDERLCFLKSLESIPEDEVRGTVGKMLSCFERLCRVPTPQSMHR
jgi:hypothetical protein